MKLQHINTRGHQFEEDLNGVMVCELCQIWFCPADHNEDEIQKVVDRLGDCPNAIDEVKPL